ncbi:MAG: transposase [Nitrospirae bacterium]|nr:transposase [Nitrospirota bacterium]MCL5285672.1 transposase [Nitrospirota bacterium]
MLVCHSVAMAVSWGREHMSTAGILSIGIDEIALRKGHTYIMLV